MSKPGASTTSGDTMSVDDGNDEITTTNPSQDGNHIYPRDCDPLIDGIDPDLIRLPLLNSRDAKQITDELFKNNHSMIDISIVHCTIEEDDGSIKIPPALVVINAPIILEELRRKPENEGSQSAFQKASDNYHNIEYPQLIANIFDDNSPIKVDTSSDGASFTEDELQLRGKIRGHIDAIVIIVNGDSSSHLDRALGDNADFSQSTLWSTSYNLYRPPESLPRPT